MGPHSSDRARRSYGSLTLAFQLYLTLDYKAAQIKIQFFYYHPYMSVCIRNCKGLPKSLLSI